MNEKKIETFVKKYGETILKTYHTEAIKCISSLPNGDICEEEITIDDFQKKQHFEGETSFLNNTVYYKGIFTYGKLNGPGISKIDNEKYVGVFKDGKFHGQGVLHNYEKEIHEGYFKNNELNGIGKITLPNRNIIEGVFKDGILTGRGKINIFNGDIQTGEFKDNRLHGKDGESITIDKTIIRGEFKNGELSGYGQYIYSDGRMDYGIYKNGYLYGEGRQILSNNERDEKYNGGEYGRIYIGKFKKDELIEGQIVYTNGDMAQGTFKNLKLNGNGILVFSNGDIHKGIFKNGQLNGDCKITSNLEIIEGVYTDGLLNGAGKVTSSGLIYDGTFKNGKMINQNILSNQLDVDNYKKLESLCNKTKNELSQTRNLMRKQDVSINKIINNKQDYPNILNKNKRLIQENKILNQEIQILKEIPSKNTEEFIKLENKIKQYKDDFKKLELDCLKLKKDNCELKKELDKVIKFKTKYPELNKKVRKSEKDNKELNKKYNEFKSDLINKDNQLKAKEGTISRLEDNDEKYKIKNQELKNKLKENGNMKEKLEKCDELNNLCDYLSEKHIEDIKKLSDKIKKSRWTINELKFNDKHPKWEKYKDTFSLFNTVLHKSKQITDLITKLDWILINDKNHKVYERKLRNGKIQKFTCPCTPSNGWQTTYFKLERLEIQRIEIS